MLSNQIKQAMVHDACIACSSKLYEPGHYPVSQHCACSSRVCAQCRPFIRNHQCPTCRGDSLGQGVDKHYLDAIYTQSRYLVCEGCEERVSSRRITHHMSCCVVLLRRRVEELQNELRTFHLQHLKTTDKYHELYREYQHLTTVMNVHFSMNHPVQPPPAANRPSVIPFFGLFRPVEAPRPMIIEDSDSDSETETEDEEAMPDLEPATQAVHQGQTQLRL